MKEVLVAPVDGLEGPIAGPVDVAIVDAVLCDAGQALLEGCRPGIGPQHPRPGIVQEPGLIAAVVPIDCQEGEALAPLHVPVARVLRPAEVRPGKAQRAVQIVELQLMRVHIADAEEAVGIGLDAGIDTVQGEAAVGGDYAVALIRLGPAVGFALIFPGLDPDVVDLAHHPIGMVVGALFRRIVPGHDAGRQVDPVGEDAAPGIRQTVGFAVLPVVIGEEPRRGVGVDQAVVVGGLKVIQRALPQPGVDGLGGLVGAIGGVVGMNRPVLGFLGWLRRLGLRGLRLGGPQILGRLVGVAQVLRSVVWVLNVLRRLVCQILVGDVPGRLRIGRFGGLQGFGSLLLLRLGRCLRYLRI